ncbi:hypothetical protein MMC34_008412 [Xylographa carneopallida]|nr:hypothetical protein [Xylographa carneopallida]
MFATPAHLPALLPWADWAEWAFCRDDLFHHSPLTAHPRSGSDAAARPLPLSLSSQPPNFSPRQLARQQRALDTVAVWRVRGRLPLSVDITAQLVAVQHLDATGALDGTALRQQYALCVIRLVNGLVDSSQRSTHALSVASLAASLHLPRLLVDVRHDSTHSQLPSLIVLRYAGWEALRWLWEHYWHQQDSGTEAVHDNVERALQLWQDNSQTAREERVSGALEALLATPAASAYLSSALVSALFPSSAEHCLSLPTSASAASSVPSDADADACFAALVLQWQPLLSGVGKRLREFRVDALRHTATQLVATVQRARQADEDEFERQWCVRLLSSWALHFVRSLSHREGTTALYSKLASLCLLDTTGACHSLLQALMSRLSALEETADSEWAQALEDGTSARFSRDDVSEMQTRKRKRQAELSGTYESAGPEPTLEAMQAAVAVEQKHSGDETTEAADEGGGSAGSAADIELCAQWVACPIGVLPHQSRPQLSIAEESEEAERDTVEVLQQWSDDEPHVGAGSEDRSYSDEQSNERDGEQSAQPVPLCSSGWNVAENELAALRPWQAAISALPEWHKAQDRHTIQSVA